MEDFFKNLKDDPVLNIEAISNPQIPKEEKVTRKPIMTVATDEVLIEDVNLKLNELAEKNRQAIEDLRIQSIPESNEDQVIIKNNDGIGKLIGKMDAPTPVDVEEINLKLNEITEQSNRAIEELRNQSAMIIDTARIQSNKVLENAKASFSVHTKASELESEPERHDPTPKEDPTEPLEDFGHIMDFLN